VSSSSDEISWVLVTGAGTGESTAAGGTVGLLLPKNRQHGRDFKNQL
jgi:hypothetical protein